MTDSSTASPKKRFLQSKRFLIAIILIVAYSSAAAYTTMSDMSMHGLTVKTFSISRYCTIDQSTLLKVLSYNAQGSVWSTTSLPTTLSQLRFTLSVDGLIVGSTSQSNTSFGPGQGASFNLVFTNPTLNPIMLPLTSKFVLTLSAVAAAGLYSSPVASSDSLTQVFTSKTC